MKREDRESLFRELETPCLLVEETILVANIERLARLAAVNKVNLRPHAKTHKCIQVGRMQLQHGAVGLTLAKVSEAEVFAQNGLADIFLAFPVVGDKRIGRLIQLARDYQISVGVDGVEGAGLLNRAFADSGVVLPVLLEVDTGLARTGIGLESAQKVAAEITRMPHLSLRGIYTYRGALLSSIQGTSNEEIRAAVAAQGRKEAEMMGHLAAKLRAAGFQIDVVSAGSTPTAASAASVPGLTEIRPGTYVFNDAMQVRLGACTWQDCAAKVLVTVVSCPEAGRAIIDAGSKVFAGDVKPDVPPLNLRGCGTVVAEDGTPRQDILFERMTEEHGMLRFDPSVDLRVGQKLLIVPNHICTTVNLFEDLTVISSDTGSVDARWKVAARGRVQ